MQHTTIDSHQHFWKYDPVRYAWIDESMAAIRRDFLPEDLKPLLVQNAIDGCIAVQADQSESETKFLLELADEYDFIKGVVGWIDLASEEVAGRLAHYSANPFFIGVRHTEWDEKGAFMLKPSFLNGIQQLSKYDLTYDMLVFDYQLEAAVELVNNFPDQRFVLDHMGKPDFTHPPSADWKDQIKRIAGFENVYCKISGMFSSPEKKLAFEDIVPFLNIVTEAFGSDRLLFGSDWPVCLVSAEYNHTIQMRDEYFTLFSEAEQRKIVGENAIQAYNL